MLAPTSHVSNMAGIFYSFSQSKLSNNKRNKITLNFPTIKEYKYLQKHWFASSVARQVPNKLDSFLAIDVMGKAIAFDGITLMGTIE